MKKIKICYIVSSLCNEGPVNVMYNIIRYMNFDRFDVSIITLTQEKENSRLKEFTECPIHVYQLAAEKRQNPLQLFKALKRQVEAIDPDMLHAHCPRSLYLMCFLPKRYKRIYTIHIYPGLQQEMLYGKTKGRLVIGLNHFFTHHCDLPIGCAESVGWQYKENKGWDIKCIPNGASLPVWDYDEDERYALRKEFGLRDGVRYFIFIGRFSKEKNPDVLAEAFGKTTRKDVGLIMLGQGMMWENIKAMAAANIIMPGFTTRVYDYLKAADYYVSASDVEGLANTILESMSVGLPMLLSDIPSHREVLQNLDGVRTGYTINNHNAEDIVRRIDEILTLDSGKIRITLQALYQEKYTARVMSEEYQKVYSNLKKQ